MNREPAEWLPLEWQPPYRVALPTGHHLRPVRSSDVDRHLHAVLSSREHLWSICGRGWPPVTLTVDQDRMDLERCEADMRQRRAFTYVLFDPGETELLGGVRIARSTTDLGADVSWWVTDWLVGGPIEAVLDSFVPIWIARDWPITAAVTRDSRSHREESS